MTQILNTAIFMLAALALALYVSRRRKRKA
jgi:LPXTG-motif cell wall-anchored protein